MSGLIFHNRAVYTADGMLVGRITQWEVDSYNPSRPTVSITVVTTPDAVEEFSPLVGMLGLPPQGAVTTHESVRALFPTQAIEVIADTHALAVQRDPTPIVNPDGTITESLSVLSTARQQPRGALLQGSMNPNEPIGGVSHERIRQAERMLEEHADEAGRSLPEGD